MKGPAKAPHVVWLLPTRTDHMDVKCEHCGATGALELPADIKTVLDFMNGFVRRHKRCKPAKVTP